MPLSDASVILGTREFTLQREKGCLDTRMIDEKHCNIILFAFSPTAAVLKLGTGVADLSYYAVIEGSSPHPHRQVVSSSSSKEKKEKNSSEDA